MQDEKLDLFLELLGVFKRLELLDDLILVGSWCHIFYRVYFSDPLSVSAVRTTDVDFMVPHPNRSRPAKDVPKALEGLGFMTEHNMTCTNYLHRDLKLEFLSAKKGKGEEASLQVKPLGLQVQTLRYLEFLQDNVITLTHAGYTVKVPEPAAYVLHKFLINPKRKPDKKLKDLDTITKLSDYMVKRVAERQRFKALFKPMHASWQKIILDLTRQHAPWLHEVLIEK